MPNAEKTVALHGSISRVTDHAILFRVTWPQPDPVAQAAIGHRLWFPQHWVRRRKAEDGRDILLVPAPALAARIAQLPKPRSPKPSWWDENEAAIA